MLFHTFFLILYSDTFLYSVTITDPFLYFSFFFIVLSKLYYHTFYTTMSQSWFRFKIGLVLLRAHPIHFFPKDISHLSCRLACFVFIILSRQIFWLCRELWREKFYFSGRIWNFFVSFQNKFNVLLKKNMSSCWSKNNNCVDII